MKRTCIIFIGGFRERGLTTTGLEELRLALLDRIKRPGIDVFPVESWKLDIRALMAETFRGYQKIIIVCYSHGSHAALEACRMAEKQGRRIDLLVCCDAVGRARWLPRWTIAQALAVRSLIPWGFSLRIPASVRHCFAVFQRKNIPQGHPLTATPGTHLTQIEIDARHAEIDNHTAFRNGAVASILAALAA